MNRHIALALTLVLCACGNDEKAAGPQQTPLSQQAYSSRMADLCKRYTEASADTNQFRRDALLPPIVRDIRRARATAISAKEWSASVESIVDYAQEWTLVKAQWRNLSFRLMIHRPKGDAFIRALSNGETITLSGDMGTESSITNDGGACNPEFWFAPERASTAASALIQSTETVAAARATRQEEIESARLEIEDAHQAQTRIERDAP